MSIILSRLLVRIAIVLATLAWAGFVFTQTIGDPGRGERIAAAVLADDAARAEVVAPVSASVMRTAGLPPELRPVVDAEVDRALRDPRGAQAFIDPFAGSWSRLLGEDDPRPPEFDLAPLVGQLGVVGVPDTLGERIPVADVPLPRTQLGWMSDVRSAIAAAILPFAIFATGFFAIAFAIGDRARVLRRLGAWAVLAGASWVVIPPLLVWLARRWAPGADAVVAVALDEAVSGLFVVAIVLVVCGVLVFGSSYMIRPVREPARAPAPVPVERRRGREQPTPTRSPARAVSHATVATTTMRSTRPPEPTAEMPVVRAPGVPTPPVRVAADDGEGDALWDYYYSSEPPR